MGDRWPRFAPGFETNWLLPRAGSLWNPVDTMRVTPVPTSQDSCDDSACEHCPWRALPSAWHPWVH